MKKFIITTTINPPTSAIKKFEFLEKIKPCRDTNEFRYKSIFKRRLWCF